MTIQFFFSTPPVSDLGGNAYQPGVEYLTFEPVDVSSRPPASVVMDSEVPPPFPAQDTIENPPEPSVQEKSNTLYQLREQLSSANNPTEGLFLTVTRSFEEAGKKDEALEIAQQGRKTFPDSDSLLLAESDLLAATGEPEQAWIQLARTGRVGDRQFFSRILRFGVEAEKYDETLVVLSTAQSRDFDWAQDDWKALVKLYEETGQIDRAIQVAEKKLSDRSALDRLKSMYRSNQAAEAPPE